MPVLFLHGVNVRKTPDGAYDKGVASRDELIKRLFLTPLTKAAKQRTPNPAAFTSYDAMKIVTPYWGDLGVTFAWNQATVPDVKFLEHLGPEAQKTPKADQGFDRTVKALVAAAQVDALLLGTSVDTTRPIRTAALWNLSELMEAIVLPIVTGEADIPSEGAPGTAGDLTSLALIAAADVAKQPGIRDEIVLCGSDVDVLKLLQAKAVSRFAELATAQLASPEKENLGALDWITAAKDRLGEIFDRAKGAAGRAVSVSALDVYRDSLSANIARFVGDVFVYLEHRRKNDDRHAIVEYVVEEMDKAAKAFPGEPFIVIAHSMGGNITYDILTHYRKDIRVDFWVTAGTQISLFEEMKIFMDSDPSVVSPGVVAKPASVTSWMNVYDPADIVSFKAEPVFGVGVKDFPYSTGTDTVDAHSAYFLRPSFYDLLTERYIKEVLQQLP